MKSENPHTQRQDPRSNKKSQEKTSPDSLNYSYCYQLNFLALWQVK